jgi:class 3 adenylate cyclase
LPGKPIGQPAARIGINLGPVRLVRDLNSQPNIIGDGIKCRAARQGFAKPGQILVRSGPLRSGIAYFRGLYRCSTTKARAPTSTCGNTRFASVG